MNRTDVLNLAVGMLVIVFVTSCAKEDNVNKLNVLTNVQKDEVVELDIIEEDIVDDIFSEVMDDLDQFGMYKSAHSIDCPVKTIETPDSSGFPRIVTRDYGEGCESDWGKVRSGKIIITFDSKPNQAGSVREVEFKDYMVDSVLISGQKTIKFEGLNDAGQPKYTTVGKLKLVRPNGIVVNRAIKRTRTKIIGQDTKEKSDDEWLIEGGCVVVKSNGVYFMSKITTPLHKLKSCKWIVSGVKEIYVYESDAKLKEDKESLGKVTIDYGEGECDFFATKQIDYGEPEEFELKKRK